MAATLGSKSYDFIIVGGGTSGLVVASRLSEDPGVNVLVLEAGPDCLQDPRVVVPAFWTTLIKSDVDWQLNTVEQPGLGGRPVYLPQGKLLGGSSAINAQFLAAPSTAVMDGWAQLGNPGWDWSSFAHYYRKPFTMHAPDKATRESLALDWVDPKVNGSDGPVHTTFVANANSPVPRAWADTFAALDLTTSADPFSGKSIGAFNNLATLDPRSSTRSYAGSAYAAPAMQRPNFHVVTGATVSKVIFEDSDSNAVATGVEVASDGNVQILSATKEVILAAGVYQSPKLLELSGIGGKELLGKHGIKAVYDNPNVGEHLQDHLLTAISFELRDGIETLDSLMRQEPAALKAAQEQYQKDQSGPFAIGGVGSHSYIPILDFASADGKQKQKELLDGYLAAGAPDKSADKDIVRRMVEGDGDGSGAMFLWLGQGVTHENEATATRGPVYQEGSFASIGAMQTHPFSRGSSHLTSANAAAKPSIDHGYLSHELDMEILARHVLQIEKVQQTQPLADLFKRDGKRNHAKAHLKTLEDAKQYVRDTAKTSYHGCGTCSMRPREDGGVVDAELKVYGTANVRVVDASIFPIIPRGNTQSTVYAVAEKAADMIRGVQ